MSTALEESVHTYPPKTVDYQHFFSSVKRIKGICEKIEPDIVIAVDALASRKTNRVATTIQMSDTGINPGSGIGNHRKEITEKAMSLPQVASVFFQ